MADGWGGERPNSGGKRPNAGRKKSLAKQVEAKAIEQAAGDAEYALGLNIAWMRDSNLPIDFRKECADTVMDRVWGKATQRNQNEQLGAVDIHVVWDDEDPLANVASQPGGSTPG